VNGLSWWITDCVGEGKAEKSGGVRTISKKTRSLRDPLRELHDTQHVRMFSSEIANSGALLTGMM
jgi:hypothetical protein